MRRLALHAEAVTTIEQHLAASAPLEEGACVLLHEGRGHRDTRVLGTEVLLPPPDGWERQGPDQLRPSGQWISALVSRAIQERAGLLFIHSHPQSYHPPRLSTVDEAAFTALATTIAPMLDGPMAAAVVHPNGWAGVVWEHDELIQIDKIMSVGRTLRHLSALPLAKENSLDARQRDALGKVHDHLRSLEVAIVGSGGLGSPMAEQLVRMGVARLTIIDADHLDTDSNLRRVFGSTMADLHATIPPAKVDVVGRHLERLGFDVAIQRVNGDVRLENVFRYLLDADIVLSGTDTHGSRAIVNDLASTYLLPVIDVGVRVASRDGDRLAGLVAEVRSLTPTTPCLWCRKVIDAQVIREENLSEHDRQQLERDGYTVGQVGQPVPSVTALTVLGSSLATCALLGLLSEEGEVAPASYWMDGLFGDAGEPDPKEPQSGCRCRSQLGMGDVAAPPFIPSNRSSV